MHSVSQSRSTTAVATIDNEVIFVAKTKKEVIDELTNPSWGTLCTVMAVMTQRAINYMEDIKTAKNQNK